MIAESIAPAPSPNGRESRHIHQKDYVTANPKSDSADRRVEQATTSPVPNLFKSFALKKAETVVPIEISNETTLARDNGSPKSCHIAGIAVPKEESGSPSPIYKIKMITKKNVAIIVL